ncbi:uncharacterized protein RAG0_12242 [Rhynchosporium agropyri]|uniref:Uncharacterized protein n=1 Tax=Rhynchosporium agropyri TaxID=914238 RepID=A0A1E1L832_9HELO|nr:uncharacterized protein RAG0_12242 [Rhynchosporium agropyri]
MENIKPISRSAAALKALDYANKQIADLKLNFLPPEPHIVTVPTDNPFRDVSSYEYRNTPFARYEVRYLQHMTMISEGRRGVARAEGGWQARVEGESPASLAARSSNATPSHAKEAKVPSKRISIADYKSLKLTGPKPSPQEEDKQNRTLNMSKNEKPRNEKSTPNHKIPNSNGNLKSANHTPQSAKMPQVREPPKHQLPPRPKSPPRKPYDLKPSEQKKRPIESGDGRQPEKRTKTGHLREASPMKATQTPSRDSAKATARSVKVTPLPDRLSPLPDDLFDMAGSPGEDTIIVRDKSSAKSSSMEYSRKIGSLSPLRELPEMLPFALHPLLDQELDRLSNKKRKNESADMQEHAEKRTVGARFEEVRKPDVPGVARKTVSKVGHPPKRPSESNKRPPSTKETMVVKLKYKKRRSKDIQRILGIQAKPSKEFLALERQRKARLDPSFDDDIEEEVPLSVTAKPTAAKKRPSDSEVVGPPPKRSKLPEIDAAKAKTSLEPPFKSPAPSSQSQKGLLATPKKGDAIKSVAMRKVDSGDGNARTPQTMVTSTPASAEKPRLNGERPAIDERAHREWSKLNENSLKLKRRMDEILQIKGRGIESVSESQRRLGFAVALECIAMYMTSFAAKDRSQKSRSAQSWEDAIKLWGWLDGLVKKMPVYHALSVQLGAIIREELGRCYLEILLGGNREPAFIGKMGENERQRDHCWKEAHRVQSDLKDLHVVDILGPWTTTTDAAAHVKSVLELYAKREKTAWKPFVP